MVEVDSQLQQWQAWDLNQLMEPLILQRVAVCLVGGDREQNRRQGRVSQAEPS